MKWSLVLYPIEAGEGAPPQFIGTEPELINEVGGDYVRVRFRTRSETDIGNAR